MSLLPPLRGARRLALGASMLLAAAAAGEEADFAPVMRAPAPAFRGEDYSANTSGDAPLVAIPTRSLFRDTDNGFVNSLRQAPQVDANVSAGSLQFRSQLRLGATGLELPSLQRGFEPQDADLKIGPAYLKLNTLSGTILFSDNVDLTENHRRSGVIAIAQLGMTVTLQLTESLQLTGSGYVVYLPLQNEVGVLGSTSRGAAYSFALAATPIFFSQLTYDTNIAGWPVLFSDEFTSGVGFYDISSRNDFGLFAGGGFKGEDRAGRYAFAAPGSRTGSITRGEDPDLDNRNSEFQFFSNRLSVLTERLLPGDVRLRLRVSHENLWYNSETRGLPTIREDLYGTLISERANMRFKPFLTYDAFRSSLDTGFNQSIQAGVRGPITDQLYTEASVGYFLTYRNQSRALWRLDLNHEAGPYTTESFSFGQQTSFFQDELFTYETYHLSQILGPRLTGEVFATHEHVEDLREEGLGSREEWLAGVKMTLVAGPRTTITGGVVYTRSSGRRGYEAWTARLETNYQFTETLTGRLLYQYQRQDSSLFGDSYYENLVVLQATKTFY